MRRWDGERWWEKDKEEEIRKEREVYIEKRDKV